MNLKFTNIKLQAAVGLAILNLTGGVSWVGAEMIFEHSGKVTMDTEYHSNLQFIERDAESVYIYSILPEYVVSLLDGKNRWDGVLGLDIQSSSNQSISRKRTDPRVAVRYKRTLENGSFGMQARYEKMSSRDTQLTETGLLTEDGTSIEKELSADLIVDITNRIIFISGVNYITTRFSDTQQLVDDKVIDVTAGLKYRLNERIRPFVNVTASKFSSTGSPTIKYQDYQLGAEVSVSPTFSFIASTGATHVSTNGDNHWTGLFGTKYFANKNTVLLTLKREMLATSIGTLELEKNLLVAYDYRLSQKSRLGTSLEVVETGSTYDAQQLSGFYRYELSPTWMIGAKLGYANVKETGASSANNRSAGLTLTYTSSKYQY